MTPKTMTLLQVAIADAAKARDEYDQRCLSVWRLIQRVEPNLASELSQLGFEDKAAAAWVGAPLAGLNGSPAEMVAAGRGGEILACIRQTMHGFVA
jgi:hypothetical protein